MDDLPESMVERQLQKLQKHLFVAYKQTEDTYEGELKPEVQKIIHDNLQMNVVTDEESLVKILHTIVKELADWIKKDLKEINEDVLYRFCFDFTHQFFTNQLTIASADAPPDEFDPAYG